MIRILVATKGRVGKNTTAINWQRRCGAAGASCSSTCSAGKSIHRLGITRRCETIAYELLPGPNEQEDAVVATRVPRPTWFRQSDRR